MMAYKIVDTKTGLDLRKLDIASYIANHYLNVKLDKITYIFQPYCFCSTYLHCACCVFPIGYLIWLECESCANKNLHFEFFFLL